MKYAEILFQQKIGIDKETLTYSIPQKLDLQIGDLVKVPLRNKSISGLIFEIHENKPSFKTFEIKEKLLERPLLSKNQISLLKWISSYYFCSLSKILKHFVPKRIFENNPIKSRTKKNSPKKSLLQAHLPKDLTTDQKSAIKQILENPSISHLLRGVTGSGKTEIYAQLADHFIKQNKQVLILVPEISLTPQIIHYFERTLGISAEVINSKLSLGEKNRAWQRIYENKAKLIIGSRSAIFAPFQDLGIIIIDEEHENSYKQENAPRYSIHRLIEQMHKYSKDLISVFGSATPSIETQNRLSDSTIIISERIGKVSMPIVEIVDMREEFQKKNFSIFSDKLREYLGNTLQIKDQGILFLNRRGSASSVVCRDCGQAFKCKNCDLPMTYHSTMSQQKLLCHHCGSVLQAPSICPTCKSPHIKFLGIGTQRIEADLKKEFPNAKILRADKDTTSTKLGFEEIYNKFVNHQADFLVGTQMITKGLDFPKVNIVGVVLADIGLNVPDFRSTERNFQLLTQVAGRSGRVTGSGKVVIQTYNPQNQALQFAKMHDYENFYKYELAQRKIMNNPPFCKLAKITIQNVSLKKCEENSKSLADFLKKETKNANISDQMEINVFPAYISRLKGKYQYIILLKDISNTNLIHKILAKLPKKVIIDPKIKIDIDPISTI